MPTIAQLTKGLNLYGLTAGANMEPGEASDAVNWIPRADGSIMKMWGARRINPTALSGTILAHKGFTYKGKNNLDANTDRPGNWGVADDGAQFSRRGAFYTAGLVLTTAAAYRWNPVTGAMSSALSLPSGVTIDPKPRPTILILQNNAYIVGWASHNLRYDPTDQALYKWGWASTPSITGGSVAVGAGGTLQPGVVYKYRCAWVDLYTGEQSGLGAAYEATTTTSNKTVTFSAGAFAAYSDGNTHFVDGGDADNQDVGLIVYRTEGNGETFHFLALLTPGLASATLTDNGLFTDTSRHADTVSFSDPKRYAGAVVHRNQMLGISWADSQGMTRVFYNDFTTFKSHFERTRTLNYRELPLTGGEFLTALAGMDQSVIAFSNADAYELESFVNQQTGTVQYTLNPMKWGLGCVGPLAWTFVDGWLIWLSDRGPYRWRPGLSEPQWIGKGLAPLFIDPMSGLCKLNPVAKAQSVVFYEPQTDVVHFEFPTGKNTVNNEHVYWWARPQYNGDNPYQGWFFGQENVSCNDYTHAWGGVDTSSVPLSQFDRAPMHIIAIGGYLYEYDPTLTAFGLPDGHIGKFIVSSGSTASCNVQGGGLYDTADGLIGLRFEIVHTDGTIETGTISANDASTITFETALETAAAAGDVIYIGGFRCYWRSWLDHAGEPSQSKRAIHFYVGMNRVGSGNSLLDVTMSAGDDIPTEPTVVRTTKMNANNQKVIASLIGRWFFWEFANSRPGEPVHVNFIRTDLQPLERERR